MDEAQRRLARSGALELAAVVGEGVLVLSRPCAVRDCLIACSGGLVEISVRTGKGGDGVDEVLRHTSLLVEADGVEISGTRITGCSTVPDAPAAAVVVHGSVVGVHVRECAIEGNGECFCEEEASCALHPPGSGPHTAWAGSRRTARGHPRGGCDGLHAIGDGTEVEMCGCSVSGNSGTGVAAVAGADVKVSASRVEGNGGHGVVAVGPGSVVELEAGVAVARQGGHGAKAVAGGEVLLGDRVARLHSNGYGPWAPGGGVLGGGRQGLVNKALSYVAGVLCAEDPPGPVRW